jgi:hypothetical protein
VLWDGIQIDDLFDLPIEPSYSYQARGKLQPPRAFKKYRGNTMTWMKSLVTRIFFIVAFVLLGGAVSEKITDLLGLPGLSHYSPSRLLSYSVTALLFVIALELRDIKYLLNAQLGKKNEKERPDENSRKSFVLTLISVVFLIFFISLNG